MLGGEFDVVLVHKLGAPTNPELAIGAVDERGTVLLNENAAWTGADDAYIRRTAQQQLELIDERRLRYRAGRPAPVVEGRTVIVLDDGLATGATMVAALGAVRAQRPARLVCAVPVAARESLAEVARLADFTVCLATPSPFHAVGLYYRDFSEVSDGQVAALLSATTGAPPPLSHMAGARAVRIATEEAVLDGDLMVPPSPRGLILFAHGSGSSRHSPRNRFVAQVLNHRGLATLLFDLLTPVEDAEGHARFDIALLAQRLSAALQWTRNEAGLKDLGIGLFGASSGSAAALAVAAMRPDRVVAVVSRGGCPDLAGGWVLAHAHTPTLLIVGGADEEVLKINRTAQALMGHWAELVVVPGATHLFEEPGALEEVATHAANWFARHFRNAATTGSAVTL